VRNVNIHKAYLFRLLLTRRLSHHLLVTPFQLAFIVY